MANTPKSVEVFHNEVIETMEVELHMLNEVESEKPDAAMMQNTNDVFWRPVEQQVEGFHGWNTSGMNEKPIEVGIPYRLGVPFNDKVYEDWKDLRDDNHWKRRAKAASKRFAIQVNQDIAQLVIDRGANYRQVALTGVQDGHQYVSEAELMLDQREVVSDYRCINMDTRITSKFANELAIRDNEKYEGHYTTGEITSRISGFKGFRSTYLPKLAGTVDPALTVTADVAEKPEPYEPAVDPNSNAPVPLNIDHNISGWISVSGTGLTTNDWVQFAGSNLIGLGSKQDQCELATFKVVDVDATGNIRVSPKPIAQDDPALTRGERAHSNMSTKIVAGTQIIKANASATPFVHKPSIFWTKDSVCVVKGELPESVFEEHPNAENKITTLDNGITLVTLWDNNIDTAQKFMRSFIWYKANIVRPEGCGVLMPV